MVCRIVGLEGASTQPSVFCLAAPIRAHLPRVIHRLLAGLGLLLVVVLDETRLNVARVQPIYEVNLYDGLVAMQVLRVQLPRIPHLQPHLIFTVFHKPPIRRILPILRIKTSLGIAPLALGSHLILRILMVWEPILRDTGMMSVVPGF